MARRRCCVCCKGSTSSGPDDELPGRAGGQAFCGSASPGRGRAGRAQQRVCASTVATWLASRPLAGLTPRSGLHVMCTCWAEVTQTGPSLPQLPSPPLQPHPPAHPAPQVYRATLAADGQDVAVKVQRPGVEPTIALDVFLLRQAIGVVQKAAGMRRDLRCDGAAGRAGVVCDVCFVCGGSGGGGGGGGVGRPGGAARRLCISPRPAAPTDATPRGLPAAACWQTRWGGRCTRSWTSGWRRPMRQSSGAPTPTCPSSRVGAAAAQPPAPPQRHAHAHAHAHTNIPLRNTSACDPSALLHWSTRRRVPPLVRLLLAAPAWAASRPNKPAE